MSAQLRINIIAIGATDIAIAIQNQPENNKNYFDYVKRYVYWQAKERL